MAAGLLATRCDSAAADLRRVGAARIDYVAERFEQTVALMESRLGASPAKTVNRQSALAMMAAMIGGVAAAKADPKLSNEILRAVRRVVGELGGEKRLGGPARATRKRARGSP